MPRPRLKERRATSSIGSNPARSLSPKRGAGKAQAVPRCRRTDLLHVLRDAVIALSHFRKEALEPTGREDKQVPTWLASDDTERVIAPTRDERALARPSGEGVSFEPELALTAQDYKSLVLTFVHVPGRTTPGWADAVHNGHRAFRL